MINGTKQTFCWDLGTHSKKQSTAMVGNLETRAESQGWIGGEGREESKQSNKGRKSRTYIKNKKDFDMTKAKQKITRDEVGLPREHQPGLKETASNGQTG